MAILHQFIESLTPEQKDMLRTVVTAPVVLLAHRNVNDSRALTSMRAGVLRAIERELGEKE